MTTVETNRYYAFYIIIDNRNCTSVYIYFIIGSLFTKIIIEKENEKPLLILKLHQQQQQQQFILLLTNVEPFCTVPVSK
ncbi:hypothetical protein T02_8554 [Trichinella nativa]|uniref:Uncharacterized protein n=1 Tax=Trichinella nativa TaxID=6335 RepID=A0A0V1L132_9BILA|nr:hypothetical protein T02_8554 [Trichinella nativa]